MLNWNQGLYFKCMQNLGLISFEIVTQAQPFELYTQVWKLVKLLRPRVWKLTAVGNDHHS